jgi:hypothetical protein
MDSPRPIPPKLEAKLNALSREDLIEEVKFLYRMIVEEAHPRPKAFVCVYCGEATHCRPQRHDDTQTIFLPCCDICAQMGLWDPVPIAECPEDILKAAS